MTDATQATTRRAFFKVPVIGWIARDISVNPADIWYLLVAIVSLLTIAVVTWGFQVLAITALAVVPVIFFVLIAITRG